MSTSMLLALIACGLALAALYTNAKNKATPPDDDTIDVLTAISIDADLPATMRVDATLLRSEIEMFHYEAPVWDGIHHVPFSRRIETYMDAIRVIQDQIEPFCYDPDPTHWKLTTMRAAQEAMGALTELSYSLLNLAVTPNPTDTQTGPQIALE